MGDAEKKYSTFQNQNVRMYGYVFQNINGRSRDRTELKWTPMDRIVMEETIRGSLN